MTVSGDFIVARVDVLNSNGRIYPKAWMEEAIAKYKQTITERKAIGYCGTIAEPNPINSQPTHIVDNIQLDGDLVRCHITTLPESGEWLAKLLNSTPPQIGFRTVGIGKIDDNGVISEFEITYIAAYPIADVAKFE